MLPLLLASASPRRRELLERVGLPFEVHPADVDEACRPGEAPAAYVARVAHAKAHAVRRPAGQWVLAADTTVTIDGAILAKAATPEEAAAMLRQLSGRTHEVLTAFTIVGDPPERASGAAGEPAATDARLEATHVVSTEVDVIALDEETLAGYLASGEWRGKAGAYAIQGIGAALVSAVRGSVTNVIGLPLVEVLRALRELGGPVPRLGAGIPA